MITLNPVQGIWTTVDDSCRGSDPPQAPELPSMAWQMLSGVAIVKIMNYLDSVRGLPLGIVTSLTTAEK